MTRKRISIGVAALAAAIALTANAFAAKSPSELNDLEIAHVAYTADVVDIRYAYLALAISKNPAVHQFAQTMIRDHSIVNEQALALLKQLNVSAKENFLSEILNKRADKLVDELRQLTGRAFDKRYAANELAYHKEVNGLVEQTFIPNIKTPAMKELFKEALAIFQAHETHAEKMVASLNATN